MGHVALKGEARNTYNVPVNNVKARHNRKYFITGFECVYET